MGHTASDEQWERGAAQLEEVYQGAVPPIPRGLMDFADIMTADLFGGIWTRDHLDIGQRRLIVMGVIAAIGGPDTWSIQVKASLKRGELTEDQVREVLIQVTPYVGYPRAAGFVGATEQAIAEVKAEQAEQAEQKAEQKAEAEVEVEADASDESSS